MGDRTTVTTLWQVLMKGDEIVDKKLRRLTKSIEDTENGMTRTTTMTDKLNESTGKLDRTISTKTVPAVKTFQFEFLGLMFAGMALQQTMFGLFNPAMQTAGVFELFGTILELFFLPVALLLLYPLTALLGLVNEFPDGLKLFFGVVVLLAGAFGALLFAVSQIILAFASLKLAGGLTGVFGGLLKFLNMGQKGAVGVNAIGLLDKLKAGLADISGFITKWAGKAFTITANIASKLVDQAVNFFSSAGEWLLKSAKTLVDFVANKVDGLITWLGGGGKTWGSKAATATLNLTILALTLDAGARLAGAIFEALGEQLGGETKLGKIFLDMSVDLQEGLPGIWKMLEKIGQNPDTPYLMMLSSVFTNPIVAVAGFAGEFLRNLLEGKGIKTSLRLVIENLSDFIDRFSRGIKRIFRETFNFDVPFFAQGGIVTSPTLAMVGESGPEAIVPLNGSGNNITSGVAGNSTVFAEFHINASINNDMDVRELGQRINEELVNEQERRRF